MEKVFSRDPDFTAYDLSNAKTRSIAESWHDREHCGGPLFSRNLDCNHKLDVQVPSIDSLVESGSLDVLSFYTLFKVQKSRGSRVFFDIEFLLAVPSSWSDDRKAAT